ncbi:MAG: hypothetical protein ABSE73_11310 [Planctomycetota bacterium]
MLSRLPLLALLFGLCAPACAETVSWTLTNHAGDYANELVRLGVKPKTPFDAAKLGVTEDGKPVAYQVEVLEGSREAVQRGEIWVCTTIAAAASHEYKVTTESQQPAVAAKPFVQAATGPQLSLKNEVFEIQLAKAAATGELPGPVLGVQGAGGPKRGGSSWHTALKLKKLTSQLLDAGPLFGKVRLRYEFEPGPELAAPFAELDISVVPGQAFATLEEAHRMNPGDYWAFDAGKDWQPVAGLVRGWYVGAFKPDESLREVALEPSERLGTTLISLQPRWTQSYDHGWFFAATDRTSLVGAMVGRAGKWDWPYDNLIDVRVKESRDSATLVCPTWKGRRYWYLLAGPYEFADQALKTMKRVAMQPLDKLAHEYILDWPGQPPGGFRGLNYYSGELADPTDVVRRVGKNAVDAALAGSIKADRGLLAVYQAYLDPDFFGYYYNHWSPINPNFATDMLRIPIALATALKAHPQFPRLARMAEDALRMDMDYSVTLPGGAGQECPGYTAHALESWLMLAGLCRGQLGFDPREWPRFKAAASFLLHTSPPLGNGLRGILPLGDTHAPGPDVAALAKKAGVTDRLDDMVTEELPGFGVVFRSHPGGPDENFLAFKAGPNRIHMHGDQLSFHYCGNGKRLAIDHMCSYAPRADQEHMHNRVAFTAGDWEYANMDGYERLIAFKTTPAADVAVGQVESSRLRRQPKAPQEVEWNPKGPYKALDKPLVYRRTVVFVKNPAARKACDYFVIRDQHWGPEVQATYCLHVETETCERRGQTAVFGTMTLFCAEPAEPRYERFDWSFSKGKGTYGEHTSGVRASVRGSQTRFITVLYPSPAAPKMESIPDGVRVRFEDAEVDEVAFWAQTAPGRGDAPLVTLTRGGRAAVVLKAGDIDLDRSQGEVGLFIPECGYDFGPVPDWLIKQRDGKIQPKREP